MEELYDDHVNLRTIAKEVSAIIAGPMPSDFSQLAQMRLEFSRLLNKHFQSEERHLGKILWAPSGMPGTALDDWLKQRQEVRTTFSEDIREWTLPLIREYWEKYCTETKHHLSLLDGMMLFEESKIYPLSAKVQ